MKPIHKALKKIQSLNNDDVNELHYPVFFDDDAYFIATNINKVSAANDFCNMVAFQNSGLLPDEYIRQGRFGL